MEDVVQMPYGELYDSCTCRMYGEEFIGKLTKELRERANQYKGEAERLVDVDIPLCWEDEEKFDEGSVKSKLSHAFYNLSYSLTALSESLPIPDDRKMHLPLLKGAHKELKDAYQVLKETQVELENL
jgi:hypothetical protein